MLWFRMAFRNILRQRRRSWLTGTAMAAGYVMLSFIMAILRYPEYVNTYILTRGGHLQVSGSGYAEQPSLYLTLPETGRLSAELHRAPAAVRISPRLAGTAMVLAGERTSGLQLLAVDPSRDLSLSYWSGQVNRGRFLRADSPREIVLGQGAAEALQAGPGDSVALISQAADGSIANELFRICGVVGGPADPALRHHGWIRLRDGQAFWALEGRVHLWMVELAGDFQQAGPAARQLQQRLARTGGPGVEVLPWTVLEPQVDLALRWDLLMHDVLMIVVAALLAVIVLNTVLMAVLERTREYGIMSTLGTPPSRLFGLVVLETALLAVMSAALGAFLALAVNGWFSVHGITYPKPVSLGGVRFQTVSTRLSWPVFILPGVIVLLTSVLVSLPAALRTVRRHTVDALRHR